MNRFSGCDSLPLFRLRRPELLPFILLPAAVLAAYANALGGAFQFDDYRVIVHYPPVHSWEAWLADLPRSIRPLLKLTYLFNWSLGQAPFGFHLLNLTIHAANSVLLYLLFLAVAGPGAPSARPAALAGALLFAVHPALTEAVTYISGRSASLMTFFYLASLLAYARGSAGSGSDPGRDRILLYLCSPLLFILAVASKETGITLPGALLLLEWARPDRPGLKVMIRRQAIHWLLLAGLLLGIAIHPRYGPLLAYSLELRGPTANLLAQVDGVSYLLSRLVAVEGLNIDPDLTAPAGWTTTAGPRAAGLVGLLLAGFRLRRRAPLAAFGLLWFFLHLLPTNSLLPRLDLANERQLYPAAAGIFLALSVLAVGFHEQLRCRSAGPGSSWMNSAAPYLVPLLFTGMLLTAGGYTLARNQAYETEITLWEDTARKSPEKPRVWNNLGFAYFLAGRTEEARSAYETALVLRPDYPLAARNLARLAQADRQPGHED